MQPRPELYGQTALRGVAALTVFIAHAAYFKMYPDQAWLKETYQIFLWHNEAVDLFFVLSGFILCYVYTGRKFAWRDYFVARFSRIYPLYITALAVMVVFTIYDARMGRNSPSLTLSSVFANVLLIQDWPVLPYSHSIDFPTWSISVEVFLYICIFPLLCFLEPRLGFIQKCVLAILPIVINVILICLTWGYEGDGLETRWTPLDPYTGILAFTAGFFTCSAGIQRDFVRILSRNSEMIFLVIVAALLMFQFPLNRRLAILGFPVLAYLSAQSESLLSRLLAGKIFSWLGDISYSIYVWHWPVLLVTARALSKLSLFNQAHHSFWQSQLLGVLVSFSLVLLVSHLSHFYFERPTNAWLRGRLGRRATLVPVVMG